MVLFPSQSHTPNPIAYSLQSTAFFPEPRTLDPEEAPHGATTNQPAGHPIAYSLQSTASFPPRTLHPSPLDCSSETPSRAVRASDSEPGARWQPVAAFRSAEKDESILRRSRLKARRRGLVPRRLQPEGGSAQKRPSFNAETPQPRPLPTTHPEEAPHGATTNKIRRTEPRTLSPFTCCT
jgi:hypothetical protein